MCEGKQRVCRIHIPSIKVIEVVIILRSSIHEIHIVAFTDRWRICPPAATATRKSNKVLTACKNRIIENFRCREASEQQDDAKKYTPRGRFRTERASENEAVFHRFVCLYLNSSGFFELRFEFGSASRMTTAATN
jgi:hypothetical protein